MALKGNVARVLDSFGYSHRDSILKSKSQNYKLTGTLAIINHFGWKLLS